jgi:hypothetical protein
MSEAINIANTVIQQIKSGTDASNRNKGTHLMMCWGYRSPLALQAQKYGEDNQLGGLCFRVSGIHFKGLVFVRLIANDTYTVEFGNPSKAKNAVNGLKIKKSLQGMYFDQLTEVIDSYVESGQ